MNYIRQSAGLGGFAMVALLATSLQTQAATVATPAAGDIFLGFRASGGQGASVSYLVNIGSDLTYRNASPGSSFDVLGIGDIGADLVATYGNNWFNRSDLSWGLFGTRASVSSTVYASREQNPAGTVSAPWTALGATARNGTSSAISAVISEIGGYTGSTSTTNSAVATLQANSTASSSYYKQVATDGTTDFGSLSQWSSIEGSFGGGAGGTALDLFRLATSGTSHVGTFCIGNTGTLHFAAPAAVPEPAVTALLGGLALVGLRRKRGISLATATV